jgi:hypothetical protein
MELNNFVHRVFGTAQAHALRPQWNERGRPGCPELFRMEPSFRASFHDASPEDRPSSSANSSAATCDIEASALNVSSRILIARRHRSDFLAFGYHASESLRSVVHAPGSGGGGGGGVAAGASTVAMPQRKPSNTAYVICGNPFKARDAALTEPVNNGYEEQGKCAQRRNEIDGARARLAGVLPPGERRRLGEQIAELELTHSVACETVGPVPIRAVLSLHLRALALLPSGVAAALVVIPRADDPDLEVAGYRDIAEEVSLLPFPCRVLNVENNTLGSYGMMFHAYLMSRGQYDYYVLKEDDYLPVAANFDSALIRLNNAAFGDRPGYLTGITQGVPVEPESPFHLHAEGEGFMSKASFEHILHFLDRHGWWERGSVTDIMIAMKHQKANAEPISSYYFGEIQEAFGYFLAETEAGLLDWVSSYRTPYWDHHEIVDWSGAASGFTVPPDRVLFAPVQALFVNTWKLKCLPTDAARSICNHPIDSPSARECCTEAIPKETIQTRMQYSAPPAGLNATAAHSMSALSSIRSDCPRGVLSCAEARWNKRRWVSAFAAQHWGG